MKSTTHILFVNFLIILHRISQQISANCSPPTKLEYDTSLYHLCNHHILLLQLRPVDFLSPMSPHAQKSLLTLLRRVIEQCLHSLLSGHQTAFHPTLELTPGFVTHEYFAIWKWLHYLASHRSEEISVNYH